MCSRRYLVGSHFYFYHCSIQPSLGLTQRRQHACLCASHGLCYTTIHKRRLFPFLKSPSKKKRVTALATYYIGRRFYFCLSSSPGNFGGVSTSTLTYRRTTPIPLSKKSSFLGCIPHVSGRSSGRLLSYCCPIWQLALCPAFTHPPCGLNDALRGVVFAYGIRWHSRLGHRY